MPDERRRASAVDGYPDRWKGEEGAYGAERFELADGGKQGFERHLADESDALRACEVSKTSAEIHVNDEEDFQ